MRRWCPALCETPPPPLKHNTEHAIEQDNNGIVKTWGDCVHKKYSHRDLIEMIDGVDMKAGTIAAGNRGYYLKGVCLCVCLSVSLCVSAFPSVSLESTEIIAKTYSRPSICFCVYACACADPQGLCALCRVVIDAVDVCVGACAGWQGVVALRHAHNCCERKWRSRAKWRRAGYPRWRAGHGVLW